jgi:hypothetical protein
MHNQYAAPGIGKAPGRRRRRLAMSLVAALGLGGCAEALPSIPIPDLIRDPRKLLTKEEQQQAISDLTEKKAAQQADAAKQAEKPK